MIKIVDFGFAEKINEEKLMNKAGTPGYIPPELFESKPYTDKGDIFSLGVILYAVNIYWSTIILDSFRLFLLLWQERSRNN